MWNCNYAASLSSHMSLSKYYDGYLFYVFHGSYSTYLANFEIGSVKGNRKCYDIRGVFIF